MANAVVEPRKGLKGRLGLALRSSKPRNAVRTDSQTSSVASQRTNSVSAPAAAPLAPLEAHRVQYQDKWQSIDKQQGERRDYTSLLHALSRIDGFEPEQPPAPEEPDNRPPGDALLARISPEIWDIIVTHLTPIEAAYLALSNRTLYVRLGRHPWEVLDRPENRLQKIEFLRRFDKYLPKHLLCFPCATFHLRTQIGNETVRPSHVLNPLFKCPNAQNAGRPPPRTRITPGRNLSFMFVQLVMRAHRYSPDHGLPVDTISKRWRRDGWAYQTQYHIHNGHLLMRVVSSCFTTPGLTPAGKRLLLFSRDDYWPYFSVCSHWKEGDLMHICKCALSHVPQVRETDGFLGAEARFRDELYGRAYTPTPIATLCGDCRPIRRCPECPTEYLVEVKLTEDTSVKGRINFRYAIIITRWSDLGDGTTPMSPEWAACNGEGPPFDSFAALQKRAISGIFEGAFNQDTIPGQRVLSMNPQVKKLRKAGESWY